MHLIHPGYSIWTNILLPPLMSTMNDQALPSDQPNPLNLLNELDRILVSDPLIDEVGFVHPSQLVMLRSEEEDSLGSTTSGIVDASSKHVNASFWNKDHKLGISTDVLLPLYQAAKCAFMDAIKEYKALCNLSEDLSMSLYNKIESEVMKHSRALLLLSCDFGTVWHSRKLVVSNKHPLSMYMYELRLSALVLSYAPKCEHAWSHRRWVIKSIAGRCPNLQEIVGKESELVEKIAERSKMNYRAWNHRCWLVPYMSIEQAFDELKKSRNWAGLHVADNSCFHYRRRLMLRILESSSHEPKISYSINIDIHQLWKDELDWNEMLIKLYVGREALWLHRRFLALVLITRLSTDHTATSTNKDIAAFMNNEFHLLTSCSTVLDSDFEDHQAQALHSATYILWLAKQIPESHGIEFLKKLGSENLKTMLNKACPEKSFLWDHLV